MLYLPEERIVLKISKSTPKHGHEGIFAYAEMAQIPVTPRSDERYAWQILSNYSFPRMCPRIQKLARLHSLLFPVPRKSTQIRNWILTCIEDSNRVSYRIKRGQTSVWWSCFIPYFNNLKYTFKIDQLSSI